LSEVNILIRDKQPQDERQDDTLPGSDSQNGILQDNLTESNQPQDNLSRKTRGSRLDKPINKPVLTILHLSDFHLRKNFKGKKLFQFVKNLVYLYPDFIFITGDLLGSSDNIDYLIEMLSPLKAKSGKYAVFGVHDHYDKAFIEFIKNMFKRKREYKKENDISCIVKRLKDIGIEVLINKSKSPGLRDNSIGKIEIIGLDDPIINKIDIDKAFSNHHSDDINLQMTGKNGDKTIYRNIYRDVFKLNTAKIHTINKKGKLRLVLMHTPDTDSIINLSRRKADIIFCGHTHGGQVRFPLIGAIISGCKIKTKFASGLFYFKNVVLYTTRGLGEGKYSQFRFYCQPEASLIRIYKVD